MGNFRHCVKHNAMRPKLLNFSELKSKWAALTKSFAGFYQGPPVLSRFITRHIFLVHLQSHRNENESSEAFTAFTERNRKKRETQLFCLKSFFTVLGNRLYLSWLLLLLPHFYRQILHCVQLFRLLALSLLCVQAIDISFVLPLVY